MHFSSVVALSLPVLGVVAAPRPQTDSTATSSAATEFPTSAYTVISARSGSSVHLLPFNAGGLRFQLGGETASYCPTQVENCPPGNVTALIGACSMDVNVPGGQQTWVAPDGSVGYTQAHSVSTPAGANRCPFTYTKNEGATYGYLGLNPELAFGATSFMACPTDAGPYQVLAALDNATIPQGDRSACLGFQALVSEYTQDGFAAWQYT